jgi:beta-fructofuranosidase
MVFAPECSDLFRIGPLCYLIFSSTETRFRYARAPRGPWLAPQLESLDEAHLYAAKRLFDGRRHLLFGWVPSRAGETDGGAWEWGGHLGIPREIIARGGGELSVRPAEEIVAAFRESALASPAEAFRPVSGEWADRDAAWVGSAPLGRALCAAEAPPDCLLTAKVYLEGRAARAGFLLRATDDLQTACLVMLEPARQRVCLKQWTSWSDSTVELDRPVAFSGRRPNAVQIFLQGSVLEVFVDERVSLATRLYDRPQGKLGLFVDNGTGTFESVQVRTR